MHPPRLCLNYHRPLMIILPLIVLWGCGPSQEILDRQEAQLQQMIEDAKIDPPDITPEEKEMRRQRLEMDFGIDASQTE